MIDPATIMALSGLAVSGVVWAVRQEGRINGLTQNRVDDQKLYLERHNDIRASIRSVDDKLDDLTDFLIRELPRSRPHPHDGPR